MSILIGGAIELVRREHRVAVHSCILLSSTILRCEFDSANGRRYVDFIGLAGLIVAVIALLIAVCGIRDVRDQVHRLVELERNLAYSKFFTR
jgi:hypothetical protein